MNNRVIFILVCKGKRYCFIYPLEVVKLYNCKSLSNYSTHHWGFLWWFFIPSNVEENLTGDSRSGWVLFLVWFLKSRKRSRFQKNRHYCFIINNKIDRNDGNSPNGDGGLTVPTGTSECRHKTRGGGLLCHMVSSVIARNLPIIEWFTLVSFYCWLIQTALFWYFQV